MANKTIQTDEMNFEDIKEKDIGEKVKFTFSKDAFKDKELSCWACGNRMKRVKTLIELPDTDLKATIEMFRCDSCNVEYLNGEQAKKYDKVLMIAKAFSKNGFMFERSLNSDGDNYLFRFPAQLTKGWKKHQKVDINPLSATDFFVSVKE
ncbi:hypothetical protein HYT57_03735 [Candidatus Woesearchaeota archaeon]|nr:hypothetical protein [Candidatus Woesearchaeota archaeon]